MSRFLRFFRVFVVAVICGFGTFSANAAATSTVTVCDDSSDAGNACVRFDSVNAGAPTSFTTPLNNNTKLTAFPYKPGYGYAGHYTGRNCGGTQILDHTGAWTGNSATGGNIYACWVPLVPGGINNPFGHIKLFVLNKNGGDTVGNMWPNLDQPVEYNVSGTGYGATGRNIRFENRGDWVYLRCYDYDNLTGVCNGDVKWYMPRDAGGGQIFVSVDKFFWTIRGVQELPTRSGYAFGGMYSTSGTTGGTQYCNASGNTINMGYHSSTFDDLPAFNTIYSRWNAMTVNLANGVGGTVSPSTIYATVNGNNVNWYHDSGTISPITSVTVTPNGNYVFNGFFTGENGSDVRVIDSYGNLLTGSDVANAISDGIVLRPYWTAQATWTTLTLNHQNGSSNWVLYYPLSGCSTSGYRWEASCDSPIVNSISTPNKPGWEYKGYYGGRAGTGTLYVNPQNGAFTGGLENGITSPMTIYAKWTFDVSYAAGANDGGTGTGPASPTVCTYGTTTCNAPENTYTNTNSNMNFDGWSCTTSNGVNCGTYSIGQSLLDATNNISGATGITLTATWAATPQTYYKLTLSSNNNALVGNRPSYVYEGYNNGFYRYDNGTYYPITASIFDPVANGGAGISKPVYTVDEIARMFNGYWTAANNGDLIINKNGVVEVEANYFNGPATLYAHWIVPQEILIKEGDHGGWGDCLIESVLEYPGMPLTEITCAPNPGSGYTFTGYYDEYGNKYYDANLVPQYDVWPESNAPESLEAHWEAVTYQVRYYCGGTLVRTEYVSNGANITFWDATGAGSDVCHTGDAAASQGSAGQKLYGWSYDSTTEYQLGQTASDFQINGPISLNSKSYSIYYVTLGHGDNIDNNPEPDNAYFWAGNWYGNNNATNQLVAMNPKPEKAGYSFDGYKTNNNILVIDQSGNFNSVEKNAISQNQSTINAQWTLSTYNVTLNSMGGNGGTSNIYYRVNRGWCWDNDCTNLITTPITKPNAPSGTNKIFGGYYTEQNGQGTLVIDGQGTILYTGTGAGSDAMNLIQLLGNNLELYAKWDDVQVPTNPNEYFAVTTTPLAAGETFEFNIFAAGDFYIDWGDDTIDHIIRNTVSYGVDPTNAYSHTYSSAGTKTIKIWGGYENGRGATAYGPTGAVISFNAGTPLRVYGISGSLGAVFPTLGNGGDGNVPGFAYTFSDCTNLTGLIPYNLFSGVTGNRPYMFQNTFAHTGVTGISGTSAQQAQLFSGVTGSALGIFMSTFLGTNITSIPSGLFDGVSGSAEDMFDSTFAQTNITSIPEGLFNGVSGSANLMFFGTFALCGSLTSLPNVLFAGISNSNNGNPVSVMGNGMFGAMFYGDTVLSGYVPKTLFANMVDATTGGDLMSVAYGNMDMGIFDNTNLATSCDSYNLTQYTTGFESYWNGKVSCAPAAVFSCGIGTGTAPNPIFVTPVDSGNVSFTFPSGANCTAPAHYTKNNTWTCDGNVCNNGSITWASNGQTPFNGTWNGQQSVAFYMTYTPNEYTIVLNQNHSSNDNTTVSGSPIKERYGDTWLDSNGVVLNPQKAPVPPSWTNNNTTYNFKGYFTSRSGGTRMTTNDGTFVNDAATHTVGSDGTWYAQWDDSNNVTFKCEEDGSAINGYSFSDVQSGDSINVPATSVCTKTGHTFTQWKIVENGVLINETNNGGTYTWNYNFGSDVVPDWQPVQTTITLDENGGTWGNNVPNEGKSVYTIWGTGVYRDAARTEEMEIYNNPWPYVSDSQNNTVSKSVTLTYDLGANDATFTSGGQTYTGSVDFQLPLGFMGFYDGETQMIKGRVKTDGQEENLPGHITPAGLNPNTGGPSYTTPQTWYAHWLPFTFSASPEVTLNVPVRPGYVFLGWYTAANGGDQITDGNGHLDCEDCVIQTVGANTTWYAHWMGCSHDFGSNPHASKEPLTAVDGMCRYHITCDTDPGVPLGAGYSQHGGDDATYAFDVTISPDSNENLPGCLPREYDILYANITNHNATMPDNAPDQYTYGVVTQVNVAPTSMSEQFVSWCVDEGLSSCVTVSQAQQQGYYYQIGATTYGDKVYYAKWSDECQRGYTRYNFETVGGGQIYNSNGGWSTGGNATSVPINTCVPIRYHINCDKNCDGDTCAACLEDFYMTCGYSVFPQGASNVYYPDSTPAHWHLGGGYDVKDFYWYNNYWALWNGGVAPVKANTNHSWTTLPGDFSSKPGYIESGYDWCPAFWGSSVLMKMYEDGISHTDANGALAYFEPNYTSGNYVHFMQSLAEDENNPYTRFGREHYAFDGLWTAATGGKQYIDANGNFANGDLPGYDYVPWPSVMYNTYEAARQFQNFFFDNNIAPSSTSPYTFNVYAHWIPEVYTIALDKNGGSWKSTSVKNIYEKWANDWSKNGTDYYVASDFNSNYALSSSELPNAPTGYNFDGYYTEQQTQVGQSCPGTKIVNADGSLNTNASSSTGTVGNAKYFGASATLHACWKAKEQTITLDQNFDGAHGTSNNNTIYTKYATGVYTNSARTDQYRMTPNPNGSNPVTLPIRYFTITYDPNYDNEETWDPVQVSSTFNGYYSSATAGTPYIDNTGYITPTGNSTAQGYTDDGQIWHAQWTNGTHDLFLAHHNGYFMDGWYDAAENGNKVGEFMQTITPTSDMTLYAHWSPCSWTQGDHSTAQYVAPVETDGNVCKYHITCESGYTHNGDSQFDEIKYSASGTLPGCGATRHTIRYYDNPAYGATEFLDHSPQNYTYDPNGTVTLWTPDSDILAAHHASSVVWCHNSNGTNCEDDFEIPANSGDVTLYAKWTCATGYAQYSVGSNTIEYSPAVGGPYFAPGQCAPARYRLMCNKNCPNGETCNACLEDFNFITSTVGACSLGNVYNTREIDFAEPYSNLFSAPVCSATEVPDGAPYRIFTENPLYLMWIDWPIDGNVGDAWYNTKNYVTFMRAIADESYNSNISFGATHYDFAGLWTNPTLEDDQYRYIRADGKLWNGHDAFDTQEVMNMFTSDTNVYAHWTPKKYQVVLDKNASDATAGTVGEIWEKWNDGWALTQNGTYNSTRTLSGGQLPTRTGYTFAGYFDTNAETGGNAMGSVSNGVWTTPSATATDINPTTWYARWTPNQYTVTYNCGIGSGNESTDNTPRYGQSYTPKDLAAAGCGTTLTGHYFNGWNVTPGHSNSDIKDANVAFNWDYTENQTFTARWVAKEYHITFNKNGGSNGTDEVWEHYGANDGFWLDANQNHITTITLPNWSGHTFAGYAFNGNTVISGSTLPAPTLDFGDTSNNSTVDITLVAQWNTDGYNIGYDENGGSRGLPTGYTLLEYVDANANAYINTNVAYDSTKEIVVNIVAKSDSTPSSNNMLALGFGGSTGQWFGVSSGGKWTIGTGGVSDITAANKTSDIQIRWNGGTEYLSINGTSIGTRTATNTSAKLQLFGRSNSGTFNGKIYFAQIIVDGTVVHNFVPAQNGNVVGMYDTITKTFFTNAASSGSFVAGGTVTQNTDAYPKRYTYGVGAKVYGVPTRAHSVFVGWCEAESSNSSGPTSCQTTMPYTISTNATGDKTLHAKWTCEDGYTQSSDKQSCVGKTITLDWQENNGDYADLTNGQCTYGGNLTLPGAPQYDANHVFNGWKLADNTYRGASTTVNGGCVQTYTGVTSGTSTAITAQWCNACNPTNATCELNATAQPGTCTYTTSCNTGYHLSPDSQLNVYNTVCIPYTITYQSDGHGDGATDEVLYNSTFTTNDAKNSSQFNWANHIVTAWTRVSGGDFPNLGTEYTYNVQSDTVLKANWGECHCTADTGATSCDTISSNNACEVNVIVCDTGFTGSTWSCDGTNCTATCNNDNRHTITLNKNNGTGGTTKLYTISGTGSDAGVYINSARTEPYRMTPNPNGTNPIVKPTLSRTVSYDITSNGTVSNASFAQQPTSANTSAVATFTGYYISTTDTDRYIENDGYINAAGVSEGKGYTTDKTWYAQWTDGSVTLPVAYRPGYTLSGWSTTVGGASIGNAGATYTTGSDVTLYPVWTLCAAGYYCPGSETVNNQTVYNQVHKCSTETNAKYPRSATGSTMISDCFVQLTKGRWVRTVSNGTEACEEGYYCDIDGNEAPIPVYYSDEANDGRRTTWIQKSCAANAGSTFDHTVNTGSQSINQCYKTIVLDKRGGDSGSTLIGGATGTTNGSQKCYYETECTLPNVATPILQLTGHTFHGGWTDSDTDCNSTTRVFVVPDEVDTYYACRTTNSYEVTLADGLNTNTVLGTIRPTYGAAMPSVDSNGNPLTVPTKNASHTTYIFEGYYGAPQNGTTATQYYDYNLNSTHVWDTEGNGTLYARWSVTCDPGYYLPANATSCTTLCPAGRYCAGDTTFTSFDVPKSSSQGLSGYIAAGYYSTGGASVSTPTGSGNGCATGYSCGIVAGGYYSTGAGTSATPTGVDNGCLSGSDRSCGKVAKNYFSNGGGKTSAPTATGCVTGQFCGICPETYRSNSNTGKASITECVAACAAGTQVATAENPTVNNSSAAGCTTPESNNWWSNAHEVAYGSASPTVTGVNENGVHTCATNYRTASTNSAGDHDEQHDCKRSIVLMKNNGTTVDGAVWPDNVTDQGTTNATAICYEDNATCAFGNPAELLERPGYTFQNRWGTTTACANPVVSPVATADITSSRYFACRVQDDYTLTYACGTGTTGTAPNQQTGIHYGDTVSVSGAGGCAKTGHTFAGWAVSGTQDVITATTWPHNITWNYEESKTFTAQWTPDTYNVSYVWNGGTPASLLPDGYTLLEYIESDGNQVIDTGVMGINKRVVLDAKYTGTNVSSYKIPVSYGSDYLGTYATVYANKWGVSSGQLITGAAINNRKTVEVVFDLDSANSNKNRATMTINGTTKSYTRTGAARPDGTLKLFAARLSIGGDAFIGQIYGAKIYDKDTNELLFNGIPAQNSNGDLGLYDTVTGEFFINQGSGTAFTAGNPVTTIEPYPNEYTYGVGATVTGGAARANSVFDAWCRTAALTNCAAPHEITTTDLGDIPLYAKWGCVTGYHNVNNQCVANEFTLVYNENGHGTAPNNQTCTYGQEITLRPALSATGWNFNGWTIAGENYAGGATFTCDAEHLGVTGGATTTTINVTADWGAKCNKITLDIGNNGTTWPSGSITALYAKTHENGDPDDGKWYKNSTCTTEYTSADYANVIPTRSGGWTFRGFYANSSDAADINATQTNGANRVITHTGAPTSITGQNFINNLNAPATLYAGWAKDCAGVNGTCVRTLGTNTSYTTSCATGYDYGTAPNGVTYNPATNGNTSESTYYPNCVPNTITIILDKNGGTGTCGGQTGTAAGTLTCDYDGTCNTPVWSSSNDSSACQLTKDGKIFAGWSTTADGTGAQSCGTTGTQSCGTATVAGDVQNMNDGTTSTTLYAVWKDVVCNVTNGSAAVSVSDNTVECDVTCNNGYESNGIYTGQQHATSVTTGQCNAATYDINYELYGGSRVEPNGYTLLEYVTADGNQYFDTGIAIKKSYEIRSKFEPTATNKFLYGVRSATSNDTASATAYIGGSWRWGNRYKSPTVSLNTIHTSVQNVSNVAVDGVAMSYTAQSADFTTPNTLLFGTARNYDGISTSRFIGDIYEFRILDGNRNDLMNLVPARRNNDDAVGFYDTVSGEFFTSIGSEDFVAGPVLSKTYPAGYTLVDYIESTGTQYIVTNFTPTSNFKHTIVFEAPSSSSTSTYIAGTVYTEGRAGNTAIKNGKISAIYGNNASNSYINLMTDNSNNVSIVNSKSVLVMDLHNDATNTITLNGKSIAGTNTGKITSTSPMSLFAYGSSGKSSIKLYRDTIEQNGVVVHDYMPAIRDSDGVAGLYDTITGDFLTNAGNGTFNVGDPLLTLYPEHYTYGIGANVYGVPVRANSVFEGWCRNAALTDGCTMIPHTISASETDDKVLHAKWSCVDGYHLDGHDCVGNSITIDYQKGEHGGTAPNDVTRAYGASLTLADAMYAIGYDFIGWKVNGVTYYAGDSITLNYDTLGAYSGIVPAVAQWDNSDYTIKYNCNTSWTPNYPPADGHVNTGDAFTPAANTCVNPGYSFVGWRAEGESTNWVPGTTWPETSVNPVTFYAQWERDNTSAFTVRVNMPANKAFKFKTIATGQFWVDWDDGSNIEEYAPTTITTKTWTHTYTTAGTYDIKIGGRATGYAVSGDGTPEKKSAISFFNGTPSSSTSVDATVTTDGTEQYITAVSGKLGTIFPTITAGSYGGQPRFYRTFKNTTAMTVSLQSIADLFDGISGIPVPYMFAETFDGSAVTGAIPAGLFQVSGAVKDSLFLSTFRNCTGLTGAIPANLFANINGAPKQYMFSRTFRGCTGLTGIPAGLFRNISGAPAKSMYSHTFHDCSNITGTLSSNLFGSLNGPTAQYMFYGTFEGCTKLTGDTSSSTVAIPNGLFGTLGASTTGATYAFYHTFYGCSALSGTIGGALFGGLTGAPAEYMFDGTFYGCSNLTGSIPQNLFGNMTGAPRKYMFESTFDGCSGLTGEIPSRLFGRITGTPATHMFCRTFWHCSRLTGNIPNNLFENISGTPATSMFTNTFNGCSALSGFGGALFSGISGQPATGMFTGTFANCSGLTGEIPTGMFGSIDGTPETSMFYATFSGCSGLTGTIPSRLFGTLRGAPAEQMFKTTFNGCAGLTGYVPEGLFGTMAATPEEADMMLNIFVNTGLLTTCPCGTVEVPSDFRPYWNSTSSSSSVKKISCKVGLKPGEHWYGNQCTTTCSDTAIDELHVGNLNPYVVLADPVSTVKNLAVKHNNTICYVPVASGNGGTDSLNMKYGNAVYHADRPNDTPPAGFGQR